VKITFDPTKSERNAQARGLPFERAEFDFETAVYQIDARHEYGERRMRALGLLGGRVHALVFVQTASGHPRHQSAQGQRKRGAPV
jgi:uncharacterized DUF497 family protein